MSAPLVRDVLRLLVLVSCLGCSAAPEATSVPNRAASAAEPTPANGEPPAAPAPSTASGSGARATAGTDPANDSGASRTAPLQRERASGATGSSGAQIEVDAADQRDGEGRRSIRFGDPAHQAYDVDLFDGAAHDAAVPAPESVLGRAVGSRPATHAEVLAYLEALAAASPRVRLERYGRTHEGRELVVALISSAENVARADAIAGAVARLADPRGLDEGAAERLVAETPAVAWAGYSIHGDEMSGVDAALAVAWHLAAGTDAEVTSLLAEVVVVMDPNMNPDGRARILSQLVQNAGYVPNLDWASLHRGRWPGGRGNHYLFDMNRDWMPGVAPETRGRWSVLLRWRPQLFLDAHEMGPLDTFLFYPPNEPINHQVPERTLAWWRRFGDEQAAAFDRHGWSYYTREWAEYWYPGYSDSWGTLNGAIGILYEQARYAGQPLRRASGEIVTYREAVHHQVVSTLANLRTLAENRAAILEDYAAGRRENVAADTPGNDRTFALELGRHPDRERRLVAALVEQGVEVFRATEAFTASAVELAADPKRVPERDFAAGTLLVPARQPNGPLVKAYLEFDPRYDAAALRAERDELETKGETKIYDLTGWSLAHAFGLAGAWIDAAEVASEPVTALAEPAGGIAPAPRPDAPVYGWIVDGRDDRSVAFAARALELGLAVHAAAKPFRSAGRGFARGSLLVRRHENGAETAERVARAAHAAGVTAYATSSGRSPDEGPDLGGGELHLLARPRIALVGNAPIAPDTYGHTWHQLDAELGVPCSLLDAAELGYYDLRRYNALVVPPGGGDVLQENAEALKRWVEAGGTLVACADSAAALASEEPGLSAVRLRRDALEELEAHAWAVARARRAGTTPIDPAALWDGTPAGDGEDSAAKSEDGKDDEEEDDDGEPAEDPDAERRDRWMRLFSPHGVVLRAETSPTHWITFGCDPLEPGEPGAPRAEGDEAEREAGAPLTRPRLGELPVNFSGDRVFLHDEPLEVPVRLAAAERLRIAGLLWPEARERIADSAYVTVERVGRGQVILFASHPGFRGLFRTTGRLLANALVYGPGLGADQPSEW